MADHRAPPHAVAPRRLWTLAGGIGFLFVAMAGTDNLLTWFPTDFGNREWLFGTVSASFNGFLSITFGLALIQLWLTASERVGALRALGAVYVVLALVMVGVAALYWSTVSIALAAVGDGPVQTGLMKAIIKTSVQSIGYPLAFLLLARTAYVWAGEIGRSPERPKDAARAGVVFRQ